MERRVRENFAYVGGELVSRFGKPLLFLCLVSAIGSGVVWGFQKVDAYLTPSYAKEDQREEVREAYIEIPKIGTKAPITFVESTDPHDFLEPLKNGAAHYPSALPGQKGVSVILGHSAPLGWFGNEYDDVFSDLKDLEQGDLVLVTAGRELYTYKVSGKMIVPRGQDISEQLIRSDQRRLVLLSCWPPGINNKRIMVQAEKI